MKSQKPYQVLQLLLVEDNTRYLERLVRRLKRWEYQNLTTATTVEDAFEQLETAHFDIIVADMRMGDQFDGGFTVLDKVTEMNLSSIVIILTANETLKDCYIALKEKRAWDYIAKTMAGGSAMEKLHQSIQEALAYTESWGNPKDSRWIADNMAYLLDNYLGQYVAIMNNRVIESAESEDLLETRIAEKKLPRFLTTIKKVDAALFHQIPANLLLIYTEGPTDVHYIKTALNLLEREDLLQRIVVDSIGSLSGRTGGGEANMRNGFTFLQENRLLTNKVLFLVDQDVSDKKLPNKGQDDDNLHVRRIGGAYSNQHRGIEWLFAEGMFEAGMAAGFITKRIITTIDNSGETTRTEYELNKGQKMGFCQWVCHQRESSADDFAGFQTIIDTIEELLEDGITPDAPPD